MALFPHSSSSDSNDGRVLILDSSSSSSDEESCASYPRRRFLVPDLNGTKQAIRKHKYDKEVIMLEGLKYHGAEGGFHGIRSAEVGSSRISEAESSRRQEMISSHVIQGKQEKEIEALDIDEMIAKLLCIFPYLCPDQAVSQLLKTWGFPVETVLHSAIEHFLQHGVPEVKTGGGKAEVKVETKVNGAEPPIELESVNRMNGLESTAGPSHNSGDEIDVFECQEAVPGAALYKEWCLYRLSTDFPLVKMSVLKQAFKAHDESLSQSYRAVEQACRKIQDSGKQPAKEETIADDLQRVNWMPKSGLSLMKTPRPQKTEPNSVCPIFEREWAALQNDLSKHIESEITEKTTNENNNESAGHEIECGCCYCEFPFEEMVQCADGHLFCFRCLRKQVEESTFGGLQTHSSLPCMDTSGCKESIPLSEVRRALPDDIVERYEQRQAQQAIAQAKLEDLVYCPFCNFACEVDKDVRVLECLNKDCAKASCVQCKEPSHVPLRCEEVEKKSETVVRRQIEEMMTKAVIRECSSCKAELVKMDGCNKVTCRCGETMCYVCRKPIASNYSHFCQHGREPGKPCQACNKCSLWEKEEEDDVATAAKEVALKEILEKEPNLLNRSIGPPIKKQRGPQQKHVQLPAVQFMPHVIGNMQNLHENMPAPNLPNIFPAMYPPVQLQPPQNANLPGMYPRVHLPPPQNANLPPLLPDPPFQFMPIFPINLPDEPAVHVFDPQIYRQVNNGHRIHRRNQQMADQLYGTYIPQRDL
eukprot:Gb_03853 [translate_table: standard]